MWTITAWIGLAGSVGIFASMVPVRAGHPGQVVWLDVVAYAVAYLSAAGLLLSQRTADRYARHAWRCLGLAMILNTVGNVYFSLVLEHADNPPYPSLADAFYLAWYPLAGLAVILLLVAHVRRFRLGMVLDGLVSGLGATAVVIAAVLGPAMSFSDESGIPHAQVATNLAYPLADLFLILLLVAGGAMLAGRLTRALVVIGLGLGLTAAADTVFLVRDAVGSYVEGSWVDLLWLLGVLALAAGPAVQSADLARLPLEPQSAGDGGETSVPATGDRIQRGGDVGSRLRVSRGLLALPITFTGAALALIVLQQAGRVPWPAALAADGCLLASFLRAGFTYREMRLEEGRKYERAHRQARTDDLTGLPNRRALSERCQELITACRAEWTEVSLLLLDLDRFKEINDSLGHTGGDELLVAVAHRVRDRLAPDSELVRLGGDEFAILTPGSTARARQVADHVSRALDAPFDVAGMALHVDASIGISTAPAPAATPADLLRQADVAMYRAKHRRSRIAVFDADTASHVRERLMATEELRAVLHDDADGRYGHLLVHLQPQVRLTARDSCAGHDALLGDVVGAEALVRWQHPSRGLLSPAEFLPLVQATGAADRLTEIVLEQALMACATWWHQGIHVPVAVNHTADDVLGPGLIHRIDIALQRHRLPATALVVELTEETLMADPAEARAVLTGIRALGARVSIDDYGSGYSSLAYLRNLPADELKLDRTFVTDLARTPTSSSAAAIVRTTADLAHSLGLRLVAEGVEDAECLARLPELGCDVVQGYHLATPMPLTQFVTWMQTNADSLPGPHRAAGATAVPSSVPGPRPTTEHDAYVRER
jgi:diguanylate cyclase (GGDEF)-like protein